MEDHCDRCGAFAEGRERLMFHQGEPSREFHCGRCQQVLRAYAAGGFTLLGLILAAAIVATIWLRSFA